MSLKKAALTFFKTNKISYLLKSNEIHFVCFKCKSTAVMDSETCVWKCNNCQAVGNIVELFNAEINNEFLEVTIINPKKIINQVNYDIRELIKEIEGNHQKDKLNQIYNRLQIFLREIEKNNI